MLAALYMSENYNVPNVGGWSYL